MDGVTSGEIRTVDYGDLRWLDEPQQRALRDELARHRVVRIRNQKLTPLEFKAFAATLGTVSPPGPNPFGRTIFADQPALNRISNLLDSSGAPIGNLGSGPVIWHSDQSYQPAPPSICALYAETVPQRGGATEFSDQVDALLRVPPELCVALAGLRIIHDASTNSAGTVRRGFTQPSCAEESRGTAHPIRILDQVSGNPALFLGRRPFAFLVGAQRSHAQGLLDRLWQIATCRHHVVRHEWQVGDVLVWANQAVVHRREGFSGPRVLWRAQVSPVAPTGLEF